MSEAEKSTEVEDVLSSIRRLVALRDRASAENSEPVRIGEPPLTAPDARDQNSDPHDNETANTDVRPDQVKKPASFVERMNASIAEIRQGEPESNVSLDNANTKIETSEIIEAKDREAHVEAFLETANEPDATTETTEIEETQKPAPFVLSPEMAAKPIKQEEISVKESDAEPVIAVETAPSEISPSEDTEDTLITDEDEPDVDLSAEEETSNTTDEQYIDEDILREIVSELVRNELQGDLGDRITRNVRKLVRREIHHALATRDLT